MDIRNMVKAHTLCVDGDDIWLIHGGYDAILKYSISQKELFYFSSLPRINDRQVSEYGFSRIVKKGDTVVLVPNQYSELYFLDEKTLGFRYISLLDIKHEYGLFRNAVWMGDELILIPSQYSSIVKVDFEKESIVNLLEWKDPSCGYTEESYISDFSVEGDNILLLVKPSNEIIIYDVLANDMRVLKPIGDVSDFSTVVMLNGRIYIHGRDAGILRVKEDGATEVIVKGDGFDKELYLYKFGNMIMLDYICENKIKFCREDFGIEFQYDEPNNSCETYVYFVYLDDMKYKDKYVYYNNATSELFIINEKGIADREMVDTSGIRNQILGNYFNHNHLVLENDSLIIDDFLSYL